MNQTAAETRSVVVEREIPYPPEKIWRALTQPQLIEEWLMKNDFKPAVGHRFNLRGDWGGVLDCEVLAVEPNRTLSYTWNFAHDDAAFNDNRAHVTGLRRINEVRVDVVEGRLVKRIEIDNHDVRTLSCFDRTNFLFEMHRARAADRSHLESILG